MRDNNEKAAIKAADLQIKAAVEAMVKSFVAGYESTIRGAETHGQTDWVDRLTFTQELAAHLYNLVPEAERAGLIEKLVAAKLPEGMQAGTEHTNEIFRHRNANAILDRGLA